MTELKTIKEIKKKIEKFKEIAIRSDERIKLLKIRMDELEKNMDKTHKELLRLL